jgi:hypothetical protein
MPSSVFLILSRVPLARESKDAGSLCVLALHPSKPSIDLVSRIIAWWGE